MATAQTEMVRYGEDLVDPETGEIVADVQAMAVEEQLPRIAAGLGAIERRLTMIAEYEKAEVERIKAHCFTQRSKLGAQFDHLMTVAEDLMVSAGKTKLDYPGRGKFAIRPKRKCFGNCVDSSVFDAMTPEEQKKVRVNEGPVTFPIKRIEQVDKAEIYRRLTLGTTVQGFSLHEPEEEFTFKPEKG